jgi:thiol-disulfide isomerase/thioredoxin
MYRFLLIVLLLPALASAVEYEDIPHVSRKAQDSFQFDYLYASPHRAFAIAPGGAWSWVAGKASIEEARQGALSACQNYTQQQCIIYAQDEKRLFDKQQWPQLWGPYKNDRQAKTAPPGTRLGETFPDLVYTDPAGKIRSIHELRGKVVFVHFWGCWCPSCRYEFTSLIDMYRILKDTLGEQIEFVVLQVREPISTARKWARDNNVEALPLSDSGVQSEKDRELTIRGGRKIADRTLATAFPASYVLDKHGLVVFSHMGSVADWTEYVPFFKDVVSRSGK